MATGVDSVLHDAPSQPESIRQQPIAVVSVTAFAGHDTLVQFGIAVSSSQ
ncbi:MAG: hypothetical protein IJY17_02850 [Alphaproteobacteria bacterium]|nr:hypothetical protein [Alphaproteobacteria bacterium]